MLNQIKQRTYIPMKKQWQTIFHAGTKYMCPFCGYASKDLAWVGHGNDVLDDKHIIGGGRRRGGCYNCGVRDRERLTYVYLMEELHLFEKSKDYRILHVAPEKYITPKILDYGFNEYVCGDLYTEGYEYPEHVQNMNILDISYADNYFDLIICNHVMEHIPDDMAAMKELYRVLKPSGVALIQSPLSRIMEHTFEDASVTDPNEREKVFGQYDHVRIYGQDYIKRLQSAGFIVKQKNISTQYPQYGLNEEEELYICSK